MPSLAELLVGSPDSDVDTPIDRSRVPRLVETDLATYRLTSAVELYGADGCAGQPLRAEPAGLHERDAHAPPGADWDIIDEVSPFGSSERHVLRASRGICDAAGARSARSSSA